MPPSTATDDPEAVRIDAIVIRSVADEPDRLRDVGKNLGDRRVGLRKMKDGKDGKAMPQERSGEPFVRAVGI